MLPAAGGLGGEHKLSNFQALCATCNISKGAQHPADFEKKIGFKPKEEALASLGNIFDATQVESAGERGALPEGEYLAAIAKSDLRDAKTIGNRYVNLEFEVMDGPAKGRRFWKMLNLWNSNAQAVEIAQRELSSICHACGKLRVSDTEELHGIPMLIRLGVKTDSYGEKNEVKGYKPTGGAAPQAQQQPALAAGAKRGPWA